MLPDLRITRESPLPVPLPRTVWSPRLVIKMLNGAIGLVWSSSTRVYPSHALTRSFNGRDFFLLAPLAVAAVSGISTPHNAFWFPFCSAISRPPAHRRGGDMGHGGIGWGGGARDKTMSAVSAKVAVHIADTLLTTSVFIAALVSAEATLVTMFVTPVLASTGPH